MRAVRDALVGKGPLAPLVGDARGSATLDDPPMGRLRGRGTQLGAITRLSLLAGALLSAQIGALAGAATQLRARRELEELGARGTDAYRQWLERYGASAGAAAVAWLDGALPSSTQAPTLPRER